MSDTIDAPQAEASAPEIDAADDLAAAIGAAFDEHAGSAEAESPTRDERGRFVAHGSDATGVDNHETPVDEAQAETATDGQQAQAAPEARPALPPEVERLQQTLKRHEPLYAGRGIPAEQALDALFNAQRVLEERPYEAIQVLARQYGVDLSRLVPQPAPQHEQASQSADPAYQAAMARIDRLEQLLTSQQQQAVQSQTAQVQRTIDEFAADPKHTHFRAVEPIMAALISGGQAKGLEQAYEMACRAHPDISKAISAAEAEAREKAAAEARRAAAAQAKAKAVSVRGSPTVNGFAKAPDSIEAALNAAWDGRLN